MIGVSIVHWLMLENGWTFADGPGVVPDPVHGARFLHEVYPRAEPRYTGRVTVPVPWDKVSDTIVNNESSEIIRMFNSVFDACGAAPGDYYPKELRSGIDAWNTRIYHTVNNGRLQGRLCHHAGRIWGRLRRAVRNVGCYRDSPRHASLPAGRSS